MCFLQGIVNSGYECFRPPCKHADVGDRTLGGRLNKANVVTIQRRRKPQKLKSATCIFCGVWVKNFV